MNKRLQLLIAILLWAIVFVYYQGLSEKLLLVSRGRQMPRQENLPKDVNSLKTAVALKDLIKTKNVIHISTNSPLEFDGLAKDKILKIRKKYVERHSDLVDGGYTPSSSVFGRIIDGKPWWGLRGQLCHGNGERSIDGLSEESRFINNPFHLLYLIEGQAFRNSKYDCFPVYPRPLYLEWSFDKSMAKSKYDLTGFYGDKVFVGLDHLIDGFVFERMNAIDFGYNYIYIDPEMSEGVTSKEEGGLVEDVHWMRSFIHQGSSCGYPGGCNNSSPNQPKLYFNVDELPARIYCKLWKQRPKNKKDYADFVFIVELE